MSPLRQFWLNYRVYIIAIILVTTIVGIGLSIYFSYQKVTVNFTQTKPGFAVNIYKTDTSSNEISPDKLIDQNNLVKTVEEDSTFKLKAGNYVWETKGTSDYQRETGQLIITTKPQTITVNPVYTDTKLKSLLAEESPAIQKLIATAIPGIGTAYRTTTGRLYQNGEWYGTIIYPNLSTEALRTNYVDTFRLVAHKANGMWKIVTLPPDLVLTTKAYPNIPRTVLVDVNNMKFQ